MQKQLARRGLPFVFLALAVVIVWGQAVTFGFVWDDNNFIVDLQSIRSWKNTPRMFFDLEAQTTLSHQFLIFRPLRNVHYTLLYLLGGRPEPQPWIFHSANLVWHTAVCCLLFSVAFLLLRKLAPALAEGHARVWAFVAALGFAVHPTVSEVVCWAKSLDDLMVSVFVLCALRELLLWKDAGRNYPRSLLFFVLALYAKESAVPFAMIPFLVFHGVQRLSWRRNLLLTSGFLAAALLYVVHRHLVLGRSSQVAPISGSYVQTLIDMFPVATQYFRLFWGVPPFCADYSYMRGGYSFFSAPVLAGVTLLSVLAILTALAWRTNSFRVSGFGVIWTAAFLLPVSNLLPLNAYMAERFLYTPLIGWMLAIIGLLAALPLRPIVLAGPVVCILLWGGVARNRSFIWSDSLTLWVRTSQEAPKSKRIEENAVAAILKLPHIQKIFRLDSRTNKLLVVGVLGAEDADRVSRTFAEAHRLFPDNDTITAALAICYAKTGRSSDAIVLFEEAARRNPDNPDHWANLAQASLSARDYQRARAALTKADALAPRSPQHLRLRARLEFETGNPAVALQIYKDLQQQEPSSDYRRQIEEIERALQDKR